MCGRSPSKSSRAGNCVRVFQNLFSDCVEMLVFDKNWKTRSTLYLRLARLISYIHQTSKDKQNCHVGNQALDCKLELLQDANSAGKLTDSKLTSGGLLFFFGSHTFVPSSWSCKKHTAVSRSSTEAASVSIDAGFTQGGHSSIELVGHYHGFIAPATWRWLQTSSSKSFSETSWTIWGHWTMYRQTCDYPACELHDTSSKATKLK